MANVRFSIVVPVFNRAVLVRRAIRSCLIQAGNDFEVVVVDDGSDVDLRDSLSDLQSDVLRIIRHAENRGVCPARNSGVRVARGEWIIFLDSDDELHPHALCRIRRRVTSLPPSIGRLACMYELDDGTRSPTPDLVDQVWDYETYARWASKLSGATDFMSVVRASALADVTFPDSRAPETYFHLDFASRYATLACCDVTGVLHSDANDRSLSASRSQRLAAAPPTAAALDELLVRHSEALARVAPALLSSYQRAALLAHLLAGHRRRGLALGLDLLRSQTWSSKVWGTLVLGLASPHLLSIAKSRLSAR